MTKWSTKALQVRQNKISKTSFGKKGWTSQLDKIGKTSEISKLSGSKFLTERCHSILVRASGCSAMFVIFFDKECKDIGSFGWRLRDLV